MQIQMIEYGLNDTIWIKKKEFILILCAFTPSDMIMIYQTIVILNAILANFLSKKAGQFEHFYLILKLL